MHLIDCFSKPQQTATPIESNRSFQRVPILTHDWQGTALHIAAQGNNKPLAEFLIAAGAIVNGRDNAGYTPLHYASVYGHIDMVEMLIAKGADVNPGKRPICPLCDALSSVKGKLPQEEDLWQFKLIFVELLRSYGENYVY